MLHTGYLEQYDYVEERFKQKALEKLRERLGAGELAHEVLHITPEEMFYGQKIVDGLVPMSYDVYDRIMGCGIEDTAEQDKSKK